MSFIKAGGWMKFKRKKAFTIIESIIYIFLSVIILTEGISLLIPVYKVYLETKNDSMICNEYTDFYINLINIVSEGGINDIVIGSDYITFCKSEFDDDIKKTIRVYDKKLIVLYSRDDDILTYNNMLFNIEKIEVEKRKNIIYLNIYDENGENFICCI